MSHPANTSSSASNADSTESNDTSSNRSSSLVAVSTPFSHPSRSAWCRTARIAAAAARGIVDVGHDELQGGVELDVAAMAAAIRNEALVGREHDLDDALALEVRAMRIGCVGGQTDPATIERCPDLP